MTSSAKSTESATSTRAPAQVLSDLIARLEKASGPSVELDGDIALAVGYVKPWFDTTPLNARDQKTLRECAAKLAKPYTASIDAALTLVPEGWIWTWNGHEETTVENASGRFLIDDDKEFYGRHRLTAIALCIAALRARGA